MKLKAAFSLSLLGAPILNLTALPSTPLDWPVLRAYDRDHIERIALPLGGIGTGTVSLGGRGNLLDWEIMNRPAKGYTPYVGQQLGPFFALNLKGAGGRTWMRALEGPLPLSVYEQRHGSTAVNHGLVGRGLGDTAPRLLGRLQPGRTAGGPGARSNGIITGLFS